MCIQGNESWQTYTHPGTIGVSKCQEHLNSCSNNSRGRASAQCNTDTLNLPPSTHEQPHWQSNNSLTALIKTKCTVHTLCIGHTAALLYVQRLFVVSTQRLQKQHAVLMTSKDPLNPGESHYFLLISPVKSTSNMKGRRQKIQLTKGYWSPKKIWMLTLKRLQLSIGSL